MAKDKIRDISLFKNKSYSDLLEEIYNNSIKKTSQIDSVITTLTGYIDDKKDIAEYVSILREYFDIGIKNDDQLIKLASVIQRYVNRGEANANKSLQLEDGILTDEEKANLLQIGKEMAKSKNIPFTKRDIN